MNKKLIGVAVGAAALAAATLYAWTGEPAIAPVPPPPQASAQAIAAGARVVALGDCMVCHTAANGAPYAGGLPLKTPFGTIYTTNITPDPQTGIGAWSRDAFQRALRRGVARDGHLLYPAFPYIHYTRLSDQDIALAYDYLMSRTPVRYTPPPNDLVFPLTIRRLLAFWNVLYLRPGDSSIPARQDSQVERGRYLADTLGHCASCHSGLNPIGGERHPPFGGGQVDGWDAPALTRLAHGAAPWNAAELSDYLRGGLSLAHGAAKGPMRPVTERLAEVPASDVDAIAAWLMSIQEPPAGPVGGTAAPPAHAGGLPGPSASAAANARGATLFAAACAGCHSIPAAMMRLGGRPALARSSALANAAPSTFIQTVLQGIPWTPTPGSAYMPPFADVLTDEQIASLAAYVRADLAGRPAWTNVTQQSAKLRKEYQP
ncbi:c-type cytochrome [Oxalobacteraceae bacterium A2-2]